MVGPSVEDRPLDETETALVARAQRGDHAAYAELVRRYQDVAFRVAYVITGSAEEAEDAAQDGFLRAYRALHRFRPGAPLRPWLLRIVANAARSRRVAVARRPTLALSAAADRPSDDAVPLPEVAALAAEQRRELLAAINALRDDDRVVIALRYFLELSEAETSEVLGCPRGTVKSRLARALTRLRIQLAAPLATTVEGSPPSGGGADGD